MSRELYLLLLRSQATRGRIVGLAALGAVAVLLGVLIGSADTLDHLEDGTVFIGNFGLSFFVPVVTLVFASSVLGDPNEDGTLVYLWLRPIPRWQLAAAALAATLTATLPLVVVPMALAAGATGAGGELVVATVVACVVATIAYAGVFTWVGLRVKRALVWGLAYVLIWEGFIAGAGDTPARLAIRANARSLLSRLADGPERFITVSLATAVLLPLAAAAIGAALTVRRLQRQDVA